MGAPARLWIDGRIVTALRRQDGRSSDNRGGILVEREEMSVWVSSTRSYPHSAATTEAIGAMAESMVAGIMAMADRSTRRRLKEPHYKRPVRNAARPTQPPLVSVSNALRRWLARAARVAALTCPQRPNSVTSVAAPPDPSPSFALSTTLRVLLTRSHRTPTGEARWRSRLKCCPRGQIPQRRSQRSPSLSRRPVTQLRPVKDTDSGG